MKRPAGGVPIPTDALVWRRPVRALRFLEVVRPFPTAAPTVLTRAMPRRTRTGFFARTYDLFTAPFEGGGPLARWRRRIWERVPATGIGLEVGAGTGANFPYHPPDAYVVATDLSFAMLERARRKGPTPPLVVADAQALPFRDDAFDWAAETLVFCEVEDPVQGFRELGRVVRPQGRVVLLEHVRPSGWLGRLADLATQVTAPLWSEHFNRDAAASVRRAGLGIQELRRALRDAIQLIVARPGAPGP